MEVDDIRDRGRWTLEYRVLTKDFKVVCTTRDKAKAERIREQCNGIIHTNKEVLTSDSNSARQS